MDVKVQVVMGDKINLHQQIEKAMHGQKKRRKRSLEGLLTIDGFDFAWQLISEPQWTTSGLKGLCISLQLQDGHHRELILEYPFPKKTNGIGLPQIPQRPKFSLKTIEANVRQAIAAGWKPQSRGKTFVFLVPQT